MKTIEHKLDIERATKNIGNRFDMVLIAAARTRELHRGRAPLMKTDNKGSLTALLEIEHGLVGIEMLRRLVPNPKKK
jgi:DNA-directed RNA polymerase omega subunit